MPVCDNGTLVLHTKVGGRGSGGRGIPGRPCQTADRRTLFSSGDQPDPCPLVSIPGLPSESETLVKGGAVSQMRVVDLASKRKRVENEVGTRINSLRDKLAGVDRIIDDEGNRVRKIKESKNSLES